MTDRLSTLRDGLPLAVGLVMVGVSCAMLKSPPDLSAESEVDDLFEVGEFGEPQGTITEGGTLSGTWAGDCEIYGYPYSLDLELVDGGSAVTGTGTWYTGWGTFYGDIDGTRTADGVQMRLDVDYYGYPLFITMEAEFTDGVTLEGDCEYSYGSVGVLRLERS